MFEVTVEDTFAAGHYLRNYKGKCENPHGHNYKIRVTLAGLELDKAGLLLDFKDLREVMKHIIDRFDGGESGQVFLRRIELAPAPRNRWPRASEGRNGI